MVLRIISNGVTMESINLFEERSEPDKLHVMYTVGGGMSTVAGNNKSTRSEFNNIG